MTRSFFFWPPAVAAMLLALTDCKDQEVVVIRADAGAEDAEPAAKDDGGGEEQPPTGTVTDSGVAGRRLGDHGCKANEDCDSNLCAIGIDESQSYCTLNCTPENAKTVCVSPLSGACSRTFLCTPAE